MNKATFLLVILAIGLASATQQLSQVSNDENAAVQLVQELESLSNSVRVEQSAHDALFAQQSQECTDEVVFRNSEVNDAVNALANSAKSEERLNNAHAASVADQAKAQQYVNDINATLEQLTTQRQVQNAHFHEVVDNQLTPAIEAVNGVFPLLQSLSEGPHSFVQLTDHINKSFIQMIQLRRGVRYGAIFAQLLTAQQVGVSEETVEQLSKLFDDLLEDLNNEKEEQVNTEQAALEAYNTAVAAYNAILDSLAQTLSTLSAYIADLEAAIHQEQTVQAEAEAKRQRNSDALDHAVALCDSLQQDHEHQTQARNDELANLQKLRVFVQEQAAVFGDYGNDEVNAYKEFQNSFAEKTSRSRANFLQSALNKPRNAKKPVAAQCESCKKAFVQKKLGF